MLSIEDFFMIKQTRYQGVLGDNYIVDIATQIGCPRHW